MCVYVYVLCIINSRAQVMHTKLSVSHVWCTLNLVCITFSVHPKFSVHHLAASQEGWLKFLKVVDERLSITNSMISIISIIAQVRLFVPFRSSCGPQVMHTKFSVHHFWCTLNVVCHTFGPPGRLPSDAH